MKLNTDTLTHILLCTDKLGDFLNLCGINRESFQLYKSFSETIYKKLYEHKYTLLCDFHHKILKKTIFPFNVPVHKIMQSYKNNRPYVLRASQNGTLRESFFTDDYSWSSE